MYPPGVRVIDTRTARPSDQLTRADWSRLTFLPGGSGSTYLVNVLQEDGLVHQMFPIDAREAYDSGRGVLLEPNDAKDFEKRELRGWWQTVAQTASKETWLQCLRAYKRLVPAEAEQLSFKGLIDAYQAGVISRETFVEQTRGVLNP